MTTFVSADEIGKTLGKIIELEGVSLHAGTATTVRLFPARRGIRFFDADRFIPINEMVVERTPRCTRLRFPSGRALDMVEHLLAAIRIARVTDVDIVVDGGEVPVLDGSSLVWIEAFDQAGFDDLPGGVEHLMVTAPFEFEAGSSHYRAWPGPFRIECTINFANPHIGRQTVMVDEQSLHELVSARTFVTEREIELLRANGLALGGSLDNAVVVGEHGVVNEGGYRFPDECARHKALDFVGDLMVLGVPLTGSFEIEAPGHAANNMFVEAIVAAGCVGRSAWRQVEAA